MEARVARTLLEDRLEGKTPSRLPRKGSATHTYHSVRELRPDWCIGLWSRISTPPKRRLDLLQSAGSIRVAELPIRTVRSTLVVAKVVSLREIFKRESFAIFAET